MLLSCVDESRRPPSRLLMRSLTQLPLPLPPPLPLLLLVPPLPLPLLPPLLQLLEERPLFQVSPLLQLPSPCLPQLLLCSPMPRPSPWLSPLLLLVCLFPPLLFSDRLIDWIALL